MRYNRRKMRYNRRKRRNYNNEEQKYKSSILLEDFMFFNIKRKLINNKILIDIQNKLLNNDIKILYWSNIKFAKYNAGFKFEKINYKDNDEIIIEIVELDNKFNVKDFNNCKKILFKKWLILFDLTKEQDDILYNVEIRNELKIFIFTSWNQILEYLIVNNLFQKKYNDFEDFYKDTKFLFNIKENWNNDYIEFEEVKEISKKEVIKFFEKMHLFYISPDIYDDTALENYNNYITNITYDINKMQKSLIIKENNYTSLYNHKCIIKVIEKRINKINYRIAFIKDIYYNHYKIIIISDKENDYTSIDKNIIFFTDNNKRYFYDIQTNQYKEKCLIINNNLYKEIYKNINSLLSEKENTITPMIYEFYKNRIIDYDNKFKINNKIIEQYQKILDNNKMIKIDNVLIGKNIIKVIDERFCLEFDNDFISVVEQIQAIKETLREGDARYNFNTLYEELLKLSIIRHIRMNNVKSSSYAKIKEITFKVNGMNINIIKDNNRFSINGIFCRVADVYYILTKIICYNNVETFNQYVKEVSYIGIEWKKLINDGIQIELNNPFYKIFRMTNIKEIDTMLMRFSLIWDTKQKNKIYLILNEKKYLIKYKNKFKNYFNIPKRVMSMAQLKNDLKECLEKIDSNIIIEIVDNALKEAKIVKERGQALVSETINNINAKEVEREIQGKKQKGYIFKGRQTGTEYFVNATSLSVYRKDNNEWNRRCIVNDHSKQRIFEDKLANRLINIFNEPAYLKSFLGV